MSEKRFVVQEDANTDKIILLIDYKRMKMYSFLAEEKEAVKKVCERLNELSTTCRQLKEENEQLKEELQRFKKYVFSEDNILCYKCEHCIKKDIYVVDCEIKGKVDVHGFCSLFQSNDNDFVKEIDGTLFFKI